MVGFGGTSMGIKFSVLNSDICILFIKNKEQLKCFGKSLSFYFIITIVV